MLTWRVLTGDCRELMAAMPEASVDSIVTDPPYGIGFMGKEWDTFKPDVVAKEKLRDTRGQKRRGLYNGKESDAPSAAMAAGRYDFTGSANARFQEWCRIWALEALRVLKPGGHVLVFGGTRTFHRMTSGLEDAGFEIRDCLSWLYGSGFPKSLDVSKAIDKAAGAVREVVATVRKTPSAGGPNTNEGWKRPWGEGKSTMDVTAPATALATEWAGWGTALKPAWEPIILARKPLNGTVAANVQRHGTGALNVDGCRIEGEGWARATTNKHDIRGGHMHAGNSADGKRIDAEPQKMPEGGRWPANVLLDEEAAAMLDAQSGERQSGERQSGEYGLGMIGSPELIRPMPALEGSSGGASRFFYTAKASRSERNDGLHGFEERKPHPPEENGRAWDIAGSHSKARANYHPTVKPVDLMGWLCRLVTRPGGTILDPFAGSGSTGVAAIAGGFSFIGCEIEPEYVAIARARIAATAPLLAAEGNIFNTEDRRKP